MLFNKLIIIINKTLSNDHINIKLNNVNEKLNIIKYQLIDNIFVLFNIINIKF